MPIAMVRHSGPDANVILPTFAAGRLRWRNGNEGDVFVRVNAARLTSSVSTWPGKGHRKGRRRPACSFYVRFRLWVLTLCARMSFEQSLSTQFRCKDNHRLLVSREAIVEVRDAEEEMQT